MPEFLSNGSGDLQLIHCAPTGNLRTFLEKIKDLHRKIVPFFIGFGRMILKFSSVPSFATFVGDRWVT